MALGQRFYVKIKSSYRLPRLFVVDILRLLQRRGNKLGRPVYAVTSDLGRESNIMLSLPEYVNRRLPLARPITVIPKSRASSKPIWVTPDLERKTGIRI